MRLPEVLGLARVDELDMPAELREGLLIWVIEPP